jgi:hypothetical protein
MTIDAIALLVPFEHNYHTRELHHNMISVGSGCFKTHALSNTVRPGDSRDGSHGPKVNARWVEQTRNPSEMRARYGTGSARADET